MTKAERKKGEETRQEILEAAAKVFASKGYEGASISDIASEKELNQSLIYHYFKDKKALWSAVKAWMLADYLALDEGNPEITILRQFAYLAEHPDVLRLVLWQQLEEKSANVSFPVPPGYDPKLFSLFINSLLYSPFQQMCTVYPVNLPEYAAALISRLKRFYQPHS